ncbi:uncharacterized protein LOC124891964, partial [Capsicum annuum]|uniref:uncharacterized protein LOC124891964 n=1 Tax=Capsicum annuum TaxID=4072 RepID=UPI001FB146DB
MRELKEKGKKLKNGEKEGKTVGGAVGIFGTVSTSNGQENMVMLARKKELFLDYDDYKDVFPKELPQGLPPLRGIEHQIDFVPGSQSPNKSAYRSNPTDTKELQHQVKKFLNKGYIKEIMSPCTVLMLL